MARNAMAIRTEAGVDAALGGDAMSGFEELYLKHCRRVYSLCLSMMGNIAGAEDLTQEVFIHLHRKLGLFRGESAFTTWLHRLTVNQVLMHFRRRSVRSALNDGELSDVADPGALQPQTVAIVDRIALEDAIGKLAPGYRVVFVMYDVEGYGHEEIAKRLGCSVGTSKSQLHRARMALRRLLVSGTSNALRSRKFEATRKTRITGLKTSEDTRETAQSNAKQSTADDSRDARVFEVLTTTMLSSEVSVPEVCWCRRTG